VLIIPTITNREPLSGSQINVVEGSNSRTAKRKRKRGFDAYELMSFASTMCVVFPIFGTIRGAPLQPLRSGFSTHHDNPRAPRRQENCVNHTKTYRQRWPWCRIVVSGHAVSKPNAPGCVCGVLGLAGAQRALQFAINWALR
jgi:hypothetical protein